MHAPGVEGEGAKTLACVAGSNGWFWLRWGVSCLYVMVGWVAERVWR